MQETILKPRQEDAEREDSKILSLVETLKKLHPLTLEVEDIQGSRLVLKCSFKDDTDAVNFIERLDDGGIQHADLGRDPVNGEFLNGQTVYLVDVFSTRHLHTLGKELGLEKLLAPEIPEKFKRGS